MRITLAIAVILILGLTQLAPLQFRPATTQRMARLETIPSQTFDSPVTEFSVPTSNSGPEALSYDPSSQTLWFSEFQAGRIGSFSLQTNRFSNPPDSPIPSSGGQPAHPRGIAVDSRGKVWIADQNNVSGTIWMFDPTNNSFTPYRTPNPISTPVFILIDTQDNVWFTESTSNKIGKLTPPNFVLTEFTLPNPNSGPVEMAFQPGTPFIWITESFANKIARFDMSTGDFREYSSILPIRSPVGVAVDLAGNVWMSEHLGSSIVEFQPSILTFTKYPTSLPSVTSGLDYSAPATIALDSKARLWFVEHFSNKVGRLDPSTQSLEEFSIPSPGYAYSIENTLDQNGNFWFTEYDANKIGMIRSNASSPLTFTAGTFQILQTDAGKSVTVQVEIFNNSTLPTDVTFNISSTFSSTSGRTLASQVSLSPSSMYLNPGERKTVTLKITPDLALSSGKYSVALVAAFGDSTSVAITFVNVKSIVDLVLSFLPEIILVAITSIAAVFLVRRRRIRKSTTQPSRSKTGSAIMPGFLLLTLVALLSLGQMPYSSVVVQAKCPGLPPPPVSNNFGGDPYTFYVEVGAVTMVGVILMIVAWKTWTGKGHETT